MPVLAFEPDRHDDADEEHLQVLHDVSWSDYLRTLRERGTHSAPRISYLEGQLEIMSPGHSHERIKWLI